MHKPSKRDGIYVLLLLFSREVVSYFLWPHGLQHARLPCPSLSPGVCSNSCPLSQWCCLTISSSVTLFSFLPSIFPNIRFFSNELTLHIRWWNIRASVSSSVLPMNIQSWFPLGLIGLISLLSKSLLQHNLKKSILWPSAFFMVQLSHPYMTTRKTIGLTIWSFVGNVMSLLFNMLSSFIIAFLPRSKCILVSQLQSPSKWFCSSRK